MREKFVPEWLTWEINEALAAITGDHVVKKETTVLRVAQAVANGEPISAVFAQPDTCSRTIWHGKYGDGEHKPGWKDDPTIATALHLATQRARWWVRVKQGRAIQDTLDILVNGSEDAAKQLVNAVQMGALIFDFGADGMEIRRADVGHILEASKQILDRVSALTATKAKTELSGTVQMSLADWQKQAEAGRTQAAEVRADFEDE